MTSLITLRKYKVHVWLQAQNRKMSFKSKVLGSCEQKSGEKSQNEEVKSDCGRKSDWARKVGLWERSQTGGGKSDWGSKVRMGEK